MVVAQGEVSNEEKMGRLKALHTAVKQREIPSLLVITKIETADKPLLNSSGTIKEKPASGSSGSAQRVGTERPRDVRNVYRSAKVPRPVSSNRIGLHHRSTWARGSRSLISFRCKS